MQTISLVRRNTLPKVRCKHSIENGNVKTTRWLELLRGRNILKIPGHSIEPLIFRIKRRNWNVDDLHLPNRTMSTTRLDQNGNARFHIKQFAIKLDLPATLKYVINFGHLFVIVRSRLFRNFDHVERTDLIGVVSKRTTRRTARAGVGFNGIDVDDFKKWNGHALFPLGYIR